MRTRDLIVPPAAGGLVLLLLAGCTHTVKVEPIQVEPIHLTIDVNVKVDRALDDFFDFEDLPSDEGASAAGGTT